MVQFPVNQKFFKEKNAYLLLKKSILLRGLDPLILEECKKIWEKWKEAKRNYEKEKERYNKGLTKDKEKIKVLEEEWRKAEKELKKLYALPNILDERVPIGKEENKKVLYTIGKPEKKIKKLHYQIMNELNLVDLKRGIKLAGKRAYVEKEKLVLIEYALILESLKFFKKEGYELITVPYLMNKELEEKITYYEAFKDTIYNTDEGKILIPTSEHPIIGMYAEERLNKKELPKRICAFSAAFRREAGVRKEMKGLFRVKQFNKVELHVICKKEQEEKELEKIIKVVEKFWKKLEMPYRLVIVPSEEMDKRAKIQYDIETWFPGMEQWRETHSIATTGEWITRKVNLRDEEGEFLTNIYATGISLQRTLCALVENFYDEEKGTLELPKIIEKYF